MKENELREGELMETNHIVRMNIKDIDLHPFVKDDVDLDYLQHIINGHLEPCTIHTIMHYQVFTAVGKNKSCKKAYIISGIIDFVIIQTFLNGSKSGSKSDVLNINFVDDVADYEIERLILRDITSIKSNKSCRYIIDCYLKSKLTKKFKNQPLIVNLSSDSGNNIRDISGFDSRSWTKNDDIRFNLDLHNDSKVIENTGENKGCKAEENGD